MTYTPRLAIIPLNQWPDRDQESWAEAIKVTDLIDPPGPLARYPRDQLERKKSAYGRWLAFITTSLSADLRTSGIEYLTPVNLRTYLNSLKTLFAPYTVAGYVTDLETVVRAFGRDDVDFLHTAATTLRRLGEPARDKRPRLRPTSELYQFGFDLMADACNEPDHHLAARTFQDGLIIALLAARPVRLKNLASIEIDRHLDRHGDSYWLVFPAAEIKTRRHLEFPLPLELIESLVLHLNVYRPVLMQNVGRWNSAPHNGLWVSEHGSKMGKTAVYRRIYERTKERFGAPVTPHLFRDAAATSIAIEDPAHVGIITAILGHSNPNTAETYYNQATSLQAARNHQSVVEHFRQLSAQGS